MSGAIKNAFRPQISFVSKGYALPTKNHSFWRPLFCGKRVIISRGLCNFDQIPIQPGQSKSLTLKAVDLQIKSFSPYENVGIFIRIDQSTAQVWSWDANPLKKIGCADRNCIPESIFHSIETGMLQIAGIDGYEGQIWSQNSLKASRWWKNKPSKHEWSIFASDSEKFVADFNGMEISDVKLDDDDYIVSSKSPSRSIPIHQYWKFFDAKEWVIISLVFVMAPFFFQLSRWTHLKKSENFLKTEVSVLQNSLGEKRLDISNAQLLGEKFDNLLVNLDYPNLLPALSNTADILSPLDVRLTRIRVSDRSLSVIFTTTNKIDQVALVKELEASPNLNETAISSGRLRNEWIVSGRLNAPIIDTTTQGN